MAFFQLSDGYRYYRDYARLTLCTCRGLYLIPHSCIIVFINTLNIVLFCCIIMINMIVGHIISGVYNELNLCGGSGHPGPLLFAPQSSKCLQR